MNATLDNTTPLFPTNMTFMEWMEVIPSPTQPPAPTPRIYFTIGAARSGKSTYAKRWVRGLEMVDATIFPRVRWNTDGLRLAAHGERYAREFEPLAFGIKQVVLRQLMEDHQILVDGTHTTRESIKRILEVDPHAQYLLFDTPEEECVRRAYVTNQSDLVPVIKRHCMQIEELKRVGIERTISELKEEISKRWGRDGV